MSDGKPYPKVVFISPFSSNAASTRRMMKLAEKTGDATLIMPEEDRYGKTEEKNVLTVKKPKANLPLYVMLAYSMIARAKPDVVYFLKPNPYSMLPALVYRITHKTKTIFDCDEWDPYTLEDNEASAIKVLASKILSKIAVWTSDAIIISNNNIMGLISPRHRKKVSYIPNGVDTRLFKPRGGRGKSGAFTVMYVGSLHKPKQVEVILDAVGKVVERIPGAMFVFVGGGKIDEMRKKVDGRYVEFRGPKKHGEIPEIMSQADLLLAVFPRLRSLDYASNMKLFEYMSVGRPTVASDVGEIKEILDNGKAGYVIPPDDVNALVDAIQKVYENLREAGEKAGYAREKAGREYDWSVLAEKMRGIVDDLILRS